MKIKINKKTLLIILSILLFLTLLLGYLFYTQNKQEISQDTDQLPVIESGYKEKLNIRLTLDKSKIEIPEELGVYNMISKKILLTEAKEIAQNLDFNEEPLILNDATYGETYIWSSSGSLRIVPSRNLIDYKTNVQPEGKLPVPAPTENIRDVSLEILEKFNIPGGVQFDEIEIITMDNYEIYEADPSLKENEIAVARYRQKINGLPIVNTTTEIGTISVLLNSNLEIIRVQVDSVPESTFNRNVKIKNINELESSLAEAKIQTLDYGKITAHEIESGGIKEVEISSVKLAYLEELKITQTILQPIFILEGTATMNNEKEVLTTLFLPASKEK